MQALADKPVPPRRSMGPSPHRVPGSLRQTSSVDVTWPEGQGGRLLLSGRARDLVTSRTTSVGVTAAEGSFDTVFGNDWTLHSISSRPSIEGLQQLVGRRGGGGFRKALRELALANREDVTPLFLVLDDVPGTLLVSSVAWSEWDPDWIKNAFGDVPITQMLKAREGVCIAHSPGSSAQDPDREIAMDAKPDAAELQRRDDSQGWHAMPHQLGTAFRRSRRIDISRGDRILIDAEFQDSATKPGGGRMAVHEYGIRITADPMTLEILSIETDPRVLPYVECPSASANLPRLLGQRLIDLRKAVPASLPGVSGCTHLNDAIRALADVPALLRHLD